MDHPPFGVADVNAAVADLFAGNPNVCIELSATHAVVSYTPVAQNIRPGGFISGPTQFAACDSALWFLTWAAIGRIEPMAMTSELSIRYLRPAAGSLLYCRADLESAGRRSVVGTCRVWVDDRRDKPSATAQGTYFLPHTPTPTPPAGTA